MSASSPLIVSSRTPSGRHTPKLQVLIVDDDVASLEMLAEVIGRLGYQCFTAKSGAEALARQQSQAVDVILSDWDMPGMTGVELCRGMRAQESARYTFFLFMTAFGDRAHFLEGLRAGADDYLTKPVNLEELEARLRSAARVIAQQRSLARRITALGEEGKVYFEAARVDPLTQLGNRLRLQEDLAVSQSCVTRYGHRYCVSLSDVDLFKSYNDTYGHLMGDEALRRVAATILGALRQGDSVYRYGGEEFLAVLPEQSLAEAASAMERVCKAVSGLEIRHATSPVGLLTISSGVAEMVDPNSSADDVLRRADVALYRAKDEGRNRVTISEPAQG